jgi:hypothetical protein
MNGLLSSDRLKTVAVTLAVIWAINKFVPATRNPLK